MEEERQQQTNQEYYEYLQSDKWKEKAAARLEFDGYVCQGCGGKGNSLNGLQIHHMTYHNIYHEDIYTDLVTLCRSCHCIITNVMNRKTSPSGRRGWRENPSVPTVSTFTLSGYDLQTKKLNLGKGNDEKS